MAVHERLALGIDTVRGSAYPSFLLLARHSFIPTHGESAVALIVLARRAFGAGSKTSVASAGLQYLELLVAGSLFGAHLLLAASAGRVKRSRR